MEQLRLVYGGAAHHHEANSRLARNSSMPRDGAAPADHDSSAPQLPAVAMTFAQVGAAGTECLSRLTHIAFSVHTQVAIYIEIYKQGFI